MGHGLFLRNVLLYAFLFPIETNTVGACSHITVVRVGHFSRPIHYTAHDSYLESFQVGGGLFYLGDSLSQVVKRPTATRTADVFRL